MGTPSDFCGRYWTWSEPLPSLKLGENSIRRGYLFKNLSGMWWNRQGILALPFHCILYLSLDFALVDLIINLSDVKKGTRKKASSIVKIFILEGEKINHDAIFFIQRFFSTHAWASRGKRPILDLFEQKRLQRPLRSGAVNRVLSTLDGTTQVHIRMEGICPS